MRSCSLTPTELQYTLQTSSALSQSKHDLKTSVRAERQMTFFGSFEYFCQSLGNTAADTRGSFPVAFTLSPGRCVRFIQGSEILLQTL